ncbi:flagellin [Castellaniella sp. GW247-6E4]|uniref:flagellin N-terminal helical domain-containing protein n=1 Tax=Castellaniella sp. GW247-6E4 TaxID=3140380 RepID=UPI003314790D
MAVINTNYLALVSQNNLVRSQNALGSAIERLSSGLRINSAKDDAAGQAIANRFSANIRGLTQASRNANDGISIAQTTEGALNEINNNLQRVRELSVQAANGSNSASDLNSIQAEIDQRLEEIDRVSRETQFNGQYVLSDTAGKLKIQVGANDGQTIEVNFRTINSAELGLDGFNINNKDVANTAAAKQDLIDGGFTSTAGANGTTVWSKDTTVGNAVATAANVMDSLVDTSSVTYTGSTANGLGVAAKGDSYIYNAATETFTFSADGAADTDVATYITTAATAAGGSISITANIGGKDAVAIVEAGGNLTAENGQVLYLDATGNLTTNNADGDPQATIGDLTTAIQASGTSTITLGGTKFAGNTATIDVTGATMSKAAMAAEDFSTSNGYTVTAGTVTQTSTGAAMRYNAASGLLTTEASTVTTTTYYEQGNGMITDGQGAQLYKDASDVLTFDAASAGTANANPLQALDDALADVDSLRSELGAVQNRFESTIANLTNTITNLSAARSRIEDADYAVEVSNMTRAQILQQAGTSVLAQANQVPQTVLSLLR